MGSGLPPYLMKILDKWANKKFEGKNGLIFFRCCMCRKALVWTDMKKKGVCPRCGSRRYSPTNLTFWEEIKFFIRLVLP